MQLSLRSQMVAGVAAVGVSAIAIAPVAQPELLTVPQRVSSAVNLTAFFNPITSLAYTAYYAIGDSLLSQAELLGPDELFWPDSYYADDFNVLFAPGYSGLIPDFINQFSFGGLSAVISNLSGYGNAVAAALASLIDGPTSAIWNTPFALITAAGYLVAGQPALALAELQTQIVDPLVQTVTDTLAVAGYILDNVVTNVTTLITNTIPGLIANTIDTIVNGTGYLVQSAVGTLSTAVADLLAGQFEDAWNGLVVGLLSPNGTLGQIVDLTIGTGISEVVDYEDVGEVLTVIVPSLRSNLTSAGQRLGSYNYSGFGGIYNDWYDPFAETAAATAAVEAPAVAAADVTGADVTGADVTGADVTAEVSTEAPAADVTRPVAGQSDAPAADAAVESDAPAADAAVESDAPAADAAVEAPAESATPAPARASAAEKPASAKQAASRGGRGDAR